MLRRFVLLASFILFCLGLLLINATVELRLVSFVNHLFNLHLELYFRSLGLFYCGCLLMTLAVIGGLFLMFIRNIISRRRFYFLSSAVLVIFYFFFLWKDAVNIPIADDYHVLVFLGQFKKATFTEKLMLIVQPINESREVVPKLFFLDIMKSFGGINFKWLIMGNGCLLLLICHLLLTTFSNPKKQTFRLAFLFLILQFQSFDLAFWTTSGICHYMIFIFMMAAFKPIVRGTRYYFLFAVLFSVLASFTFGNGLLVFPVCCVLLLFQGRIKRSIVFALIMVATLLIYFYAWPYPKSNVDFNPIGIVIYALGFLGSSMQFMYYLYIPVIAGLFCISVFLYSTIKKYYRRNPFAWAILLFIILTAFTTALFRLDSSPLQSRYGLYSIAAIVLCIITLVDLQAQSNQIFPLTSSSPLRVRPLADIPRLILLLAICYNFLSGIMFYPEAPIRKVKLLNFVNDWRTGKPLTYDPPVIFDHADKYLEEAKKSGIWDE